MERKPVVGIMGDANVPTKVLKEAYELGSLIAENGWILLNGGRDAGVMRASAEGAKSRNGLTIGILPGSSKRDANPFIDIPVVTSLSDARNLINVLTSDIVVALKGSAGTISEIALALKNGKHVILYNFPVQKMFEEFISMGILHTVSSGKDCIRLIKELLQK